MTMIGFLGSTKRLVTMAMLSFATGLADAESARAEDTPWPLAAVGRIAVGPRATCSAALIEPDVILTAAHCARDLGADGKDHAFITGSYPGLPSERLKVVTSSVHPFFLLNLGGDLAVVRFDLAVARLETPPADPRIVPIPLAEGPILGERLILAGYRGGRGDSARERRCEVFEEVREAFAIGCEVKSGESGSPVIRVGDGGLGITAVLTSRTRTDEQPIGLIAPVLPKVLPVLDALETP